MATDLERLVVQLSADVRGFQQEMLKANGIASKQARAIENRFRSMGRTLDGLMSGAARNITAPLAGVAAALSVREVLQYADAWTKAKNSLAVAGITGRQQAKVLDQLFASAQRNATPIGALTDLFGKASQASDNLGASQSDLIAFTDGVATALQVAGTGATEASGALQQLGQLLGSATVQAEEFNSVADGARPILIAVANGLDEAGGSVNRLKQLVNQGKVSGREFFQAFLRGLPSIQSMAANSTQTIEQGVTKVNNAFTRYIGQTDSSLGASQRLAGALNALADNFDKTADVTLMLAGVIAGALVGRSLVAMIGKLGLATTAVIRLTAALRAAGNIRSLAAAFGGLGAAAGPIGAIVGVAAAVAVEHFGGQALDAEARTGQLRQEMEELGLAAKSAAPEIDKAATSINNLAPEDVRRRLENVRAELDRLQGQSWSGILFGSADTIGDIESALSGLRRPARGRNNGAAERAAAEELTVILSLAKAGAISVDEMNRRLDEIAAKKISQPVDDLIAAMRQLLPYYRQVAAYQDQLANGPAPRAANPRAMGAERAAAWQRKAAGVAALDAASREVTMTEGEKRLEAEMERLRKAIEQQSPGAIVSDAQLRDQAQSNIAAGDLTRTIDDYVADAIRAESGGRANARNPNSSASGIGQFIESTWLDLFKRYFPDRAKGMSDAAILALRNLESESETTKKLIGAYARENADVLQKAGVTVTEAALQLAHFLGAGDAAKVLKAAPGTPLKGLISDASIAANPSILGGGRTVEDAIAYAQSRVGGGTAGAQRFSTNEDFAAWLEQEKQGLALTQEEIALRQRLGPLTADNAAAYAEFQRAQELLTQAQQAGAAVALEVHDVNMLLHGDLTQLSPAAREQAEAMRALAEQYGMTQAAGESFDAAQTKLRDQVQSVNDIGRDALGTLISDLRQGKSAAEAMADVLDRIADRLINMALDAVFSSGSDGTGGLLGGLMKAFGFADGGVVHAATGGRISGPGTSRSDSVPAMLSNGEFVVNAAATARHRRLLEAINSGTALRLAGGGSVNAPAIPMASRPAGVTLAPTYAIDARGSQMSEAQFRAILKENNKQMARHVEKVVIPRYDANRWRQG